MTAQVDPTKFKRILTRAIVLPLLLMAALAGIFLWQISRLLAASRLVDHTDQVIAQANNTQKLLIDMETGVRGFLITSDGAFLEPYNKALAVVPDAFDGLARLVSDNPPQVQRVNEIRAAYEQWETYARDIIALRTKGGDYQSVAAGRHGKNLMDGMRAQFADFVHTEENLRDERTAATKRESRLTIATAIILTILLGSILAYLARRQLFRLSKSYEEALGAEQKQREQLRVTLNSIGDAVIATDAGGRVTFMNPIAESVIGWTREEANGQELAKVFHIINAETREPVESPVEKVLREGKIIGLANHTVLLAKDGREVPIDDSSAPIKDADGNTSGVVLVFRDVTNQKQLEEARAQLASIVESSEDAIIGKALDGTILSWNSGAERLYGYTASEVAARSISILAPPDHTDEIPRILEQIKAGKAVNHHETVRVDKDGRAIDIALTVSPIKNSQGRIVGASTIARDITERKRAAAERERLSAELISMQAARLEELSTPLIPLSRDIVIMPLIGTIDSERAARILDALSNGVVSHKARFAILDITGVLMVDTHVANVLVQAAQIVRLLGAEVLLTGIRAGVAQTLVGLGVDLKNLVTRKDLQSGVAYAITNLRQAKTLD